MLDTCQSEGVQRVELWAFEPSDEIRSQLAERMQSAPPNYRVSVRSEAVSDAIGQAEFDATPGITGVKHLLTDESIAEGQTPSVVVTVTTLAEVFEEEGIDAVDFVKSDVEGFDFSALRGAASLLAEGRIGLFQFEYNHRWISTRTFLKDVFDLAESLPYQVCKVVSGGIDAYESWHPELETFFEANYVLVRDDLLDVLDVRKGKFTANNTYATSEQSGSPRGALSVLSLRVCGFFPARTIFLATSRSSTPHPFREPSQAPFRRRVGCDRRVASDT